MLTPQHLLPIHDELVVDLFTGGGGVCPPLARALVAANYSERQAERLVA